jgi:ElaB/YqjD/DUF883 family membrane-anchored ribosome-binding protein
MVNAPSSSGQPDTGKTASQSGPCPPDCDLPENAQENLDAKLDHAIEETFPTSDPVSVNITKGGAIDYDQQDAASATSSRQDQEGEDSIESILDQVRDALRDVTESASGAAREVYSQGQHYVRQARERSPEAARYYQDGSRAISQRVTETPWLSLAVAGAAGYGLGWMIHGRWSNHGQ